MADETGTFLQAFHFNLCLSDNKRSIRIEVSKSEPDNDRRNFYSAIYGVLLHVILIHAASYP